MVVEALQAAFGAKKMNVAFFGNSFGHAHWNVSRVTALIRFRETLSEPWIAS
ncbi:hypothetical protein SAMN05192563_1004343 [Paraburkholderia aspalathi]|uniref:Uncharacterized protein n=1 Tax=Paraburkholderia aspalathi TaxID=1324617 RepID=A0A1I7BBU2_9BURK|nr:hypothetical protein SAMN05192563_1004343 [Paraburkholderia aspalathi]